MSERSPPLSVLTEALNQSLNLLTCSYSSDPDDPECVDIDLAGSVITSKSLFQRLLSSEST
jgi:hypothetical protein